MLRYCKHPSSRFDTNVDIYIEKVAKDCVKSVADFNTHYEGCPYAHKPAEVPEDVRDILANQHVYTGLIFR